MVSDNAPLFSHHQETLDNNTLGYLGGYSFEERQWALMLNDVGHDFDEALERLALPSWRWS